MFTKLLKLIGTKPEEEKLVTLLLANGFFLGIFIATYQISAENMFIEQFVEQLDYAYLAQGFLGVFATIFFAYFQNRVSFPSLIVFVLSSVFLFLITVLVLFKVYYHKYLIYLLFVMMGPLTALVILIFWGVFGRLFDNRQSKRIIGGIDTGQLSGTILASSLIIVLSNKGWIKDDIIQLYVSAVSILGALIFLLIIIRDYDLNIVRKKTREEAKETGYIKIVKDRYVLLLSVFLIISVIIFKFIDFSYLQTLTLQFPEESYRRTFLAKMTIGIMVLSFLIQTFLNDRIIMNYGLKVSLLILPIILLFFTFAAIISGEIFGYSPADGGAFIFFFLSITLSKLFSTSIKDALENPAFKLFFLPLDNKIRFDIQAKVEGVVNQIGITIAGIVLVILGLGFFTYVELIHYSYLLIVVLAIIIYVVSKLYNEYRISLKKKLEQQKEDSEILVGAERRVTNLILIDIQSHDYIKAIFSLKMLEIVNPIIFEKKIFKYLGHASEQVREYVLLKIESLRLTNSSKYISEFMESNRSDKLKNLALEIYNNLEDSNSIKLSQFQFFILVKSENPMDREYAAKFLKAVWNDSYDQFLIELLRDKNPKVRRTAIVTAGIIKHTQFLKYLISNLSLHQYKHATASAIVNLSDRALKQLEVTFYKTDQSLMVREQIVKIYGRIGTERAVELLWTKTNFPNKEIVSLSIHSLTLSDIKISETQISTVKHLIDNHIEIFTWNSAVLANLPHGRNWKKLRLAMEQENVYNVDQLYLLLSLMYDKQSIQLVRENINSGSVDGVTFAIELLDVFVSDDIKPKLVAVLDDISHGEVVRRLSEYFPQEEYSNVEMLKQIVNRDFNTINRWTKACAIYNLALHDGAEVCDELIANIFNSDFFLRETAAWAIYQIDPQAYEYHTKRLKENIKAALDKNILPTNTGSFSIGRIRFHDIAFLKKIKMFSDLDWITVVNVVEHMQEIDLPEGKSIKNNDNIYIVKKGSIEMEKKNGKIVKMGERNIFGNLLMYERGATDSVFAFRDAILLSIDREVLLGLISSRIKQFNQLAPNMGDIFRTKFEKDYTSIREII